MYVRFGAAVLALAAGAAGIVVAVMLLRSVPGPPAAAATSAAPVPIEPASPAVPGGRIATPGDPGFPAPPPGAVVLSREAGSRALALAVKPGLVRVSVLRPAGGGEAGLKVSLRFGRGYFLPADPCGAGCYQAEVSGLPQSPVTVQLGGDAYRFTLPELPAADATAIVRRASSAWNGLRTLTWRERLASSPTKALRTVYRAVAPDRLSYDITGRSSAVIIGGTRWDRATPTAPWRSSVQNPQLRQPQPFWQEATDARVLGTGRFHGRPVWRVSFFDPSTPSWFEATIDRRSYRTLALEMVAASHFMYDEYGPFDAPLELHAPAAT